MADVPPDTDVPAHADGDPNAHGNCGPNSAEHVPNHNSCTLAYPAANDSFADS